MRRKGPDKRKECNSLAAASRRVLATFFESTPQHIKTIKDIVAMTTLQQQCIHLRTLPRAKRGDLVITFDESEFYMRLTGKRRGNIYHLMMLHGTLQWTLHDGSKKTYQLVMTPTVIKKKSADCMIGSIHRRLPLPLSELRSKVDHLNVAVGNDSAKACIKADRHYQNLSHLDTTGRGVLGLSGPCQMHMFGVSMFSMSKPLNIICPMFCACVLTHQGKVFDKFRDKVAARFKRMEIGDIVQDAPDPAFVAGLVQLLSMDSWDSEVEHIAPEFGERKRRNDERSVAIRRLAEDLAVSEWDGVNGILKRYRHYCPLGCCDTLEEAREKVAGNVLSVCLPAPPDIPACNRWLLLRAPAVFWAIIVTLGLDQEFGEVARNEMDDELDMLDEDDVMGPGAEDTYHKKKHVRCKKVLGWVGKVVNGLKITPLVLRVFCTLLLICTAMMRVLFKAAERGQDFGIDNFCIPARNPARRAAQRLLDLLQNMEHTVWVPIYVTYGLGWNQEAKDMVFTCAYSLIGNIHLRSISPFEKQWNYLLCTALSEEVDAAERLRLRTAFLTRKECCMRKGAATALHSQISSLADFESKQVAIENVQSMYRACPSQVNVYPLLGRLNCFGRPERSLKVKKILF